MCRPCTGLHPGFAKTMPGAEGIRALRHRRSLIAHMRLAARDGGAHEHPYICTTRAVRGGARPDTAAWPSSQPGLPDAIAFHDTLRPLRRPRRRLVPPSTRPGATNFFLPTGASIAASAHLL